MLFRQDVGERALEPGAAAHPGEQAGHRGVHDGAGGEAGVSRQLADNREQGLHDKTRLRPHRVRCSLVEKIVFFSAYVYEQDI